MAKSSPTSKKKKTAGKGEIARQEQFFLFPQCFKRLLHVKKRAWLGKG